MRTKSSRDFARRLLYCFSSPTVELVWPRSGASECSVICWCLSSLFTSVIMSRIDSEVVRQAKYVLIDGWVQCISTALLKISPSTSSYQQAIAREDAGSFLPDESHASCWSNSERHSAESLYTWSLTSGVSRRGSALECQRLTFLADLNGFPIVQISVRFRTTRSTNRTSTVG